MTLEIKPITAQQTWLLRQTVMWPDKNLDFIKLKEDPGGLHFGGYLGDDLIVVISLFSDGKKTQFRKFATKKEFQGKGYGSQLLKFIINFSKSKKHKTLWCNAREDKTIFYERFGLTKTDITFKKSEVLFRIMSLTLT